MLLPTFLKTADLAFPFPLPLDTGTQDSALEEKQQHKEDTSKRQLALTLAGRRQRGRVMTGATWSAQVLCSGTAATRTQPHCYWPLEFFERKLENDILGGNRPVFTVVA